MIYRVIDRETISSLTAAVGFTTTKIPPTVVTVVYAFIQAVGGDVRFTVDGTTPTTSLGVILKENCSCEIWGSDALTNFLAIDDGGTATLEVVYMGGG